MTDFLLELACEEIPARMQAKARSDLAKLFTDQLAAAGITASGVTVYSTPRRLALIARGLPQATAAVSEEAKGPPEGAPDAAIDGFCRKNGVTRDQLELREVKGRNIWFAVINRPGQATSDVLAQAIPGIVRAFPWPKSQRWGAASRSTESLRWVRPLSGILAIFGDSVVGCEVDGIVAGRETIGHRFMGEHPGARIAINSAERYAAQLRAAFVIVDQEERAAIIRSGATAAASAAGLTLINDEALVIENAGLTEWPVPLLGRFDAAFLEVPPEVIQLTARVNQKYFVCEAPGGRLANAFVCIANIAAHDGGKAIVAGNEKVLAARLSDAKFFWELDQKTSLAEHANKLERITFHEKLGTLADKVERVAKLARWLSEEGIVTSSPLPFRGGAGGGGRPSDLAHADAPHPNPSPEGEGLTRAQLADLAELAARLCKADLVTEMVGEFPELQGVMGGYYARAEGYKYLVTPAQAGVQPDSERLGGENDLDSRLRGNDNEVGTSSPFTGLTREAIDMVADAIRDHYKPVGQGDDVPTAPVTVAVSLADKLDTICAFFSEDLPPSGSKDPFALRRAALGVISTIINNSLRFDLGETINAIATMLVDRHDPKLTLDDLGLQMTQYLRLADKGVIGRELAKQMILAVPEQDFQKESDKAWRVLIIESAILTFFADRLKVQQREAGVRHDLIDAVFALGNEDDLVRLLARVHALQDFVTTEDGANLLAGYKRAANILKSSPERGGGSGAVADGGAESALSTDLQGDSAQPLHQPAAGPPPRSGEELALLTALDAAEPVAETAIAEERFADAMTALASLRAPIDAFFDGVMVNDPDPIKKRFRLGLLARFTDAVHRVADFSKIEG